MEVSIELHTIHSVWSIVYILNKSENATPELFAIYIQNYASQECNIGGILMFKYWVMHNSKSHRKHMKAI